MTLQIFLEQRQPQIQCQEPKTSGRLPRVLHTLCKCRSRLKGAITFRGFFARLVVCGGSPWSNELRMQAWDSHRPEPRQIRPPPPLPRPQLPPDSAPATPAGSVGLLPGWYFGPEGSDVREGDGEALQQLRCHVRTRSSPTSSSQAGGGGADQLGGKGPWSVSNCGSSSTFWVDQNHSCTLPSARERLQRRAIDPATAAAAARCAAGTARGGAWWPGPVGRANPRASAIGRSHTSI